MSTPGIPYDSAPYSTESTETRAVVPEQEEQSSAPAAFPARTLLILAVVCLGQLMVLIDASIINVALPTIKTALNFSESDLQWVITAYALMFAGFLLLGGRAADLLGRRVVFLAGFALFTAASVVAGLAQTPTVLIVSRGLQGLGGAIMYPAALSILLVTFHEGIQRNRALAVWGAVAGGGTALGVILGGVLTQGPGWRWVFFINVPVGVLGLLAAPRILTESRAEGEARSYDLPGTLTVTASLILLVYSVSQVPTYGWGAGRTIAGLIGAAVLLATFVLIEGRFASHPLVPLRLFRSPTVSGANLTMGILGASLFGVFFFVSLYMQQILHFSAAQAGLAYLPLTVGIVVSAGVGTALIGRIGAKSLLTAGLLFIATGILLLLRTPVHGTYVSDLLPAFVLVALGAGLSFPAVTNAGVSGASPSDAGIASALVNTFQQVGGAIGLGVLSTIASTRTSDVLRTRPQGGLPHALVEGFHQAFLVGGVVSAAGALVALLLISQRVGRARPSSAPTGAADSDEHTVDAQTAGV